jgi:hypothetical protein
MKLVWAILFYVAVAVCLWPLYVNATEVVTYAQGAHRLFRLPPGGVVVAALQAVLLMWAIGGAIVLFRKNQPGFAWLVVLLALAPMLARMTERTL